MQNDQQHSNGQNVPARVSPRTRAAAAQRLIERPLPVPHGVYYDGPHSPRHPSGWYLRRHLKRKYLHRSNLRYTAVERFGTRWSLMPMALSLLLLFFLSASTFVVYTSFANAVNQHYQQDLLTLADILPGDSLRLYDEHGTLIYQATDQGLQTSEPLNKISPDLMDAEIAIEDQNFWTNPGYDITGIVRAALANYSSGHIVAGGSTITQQLIKNAIVGKQDSILRKLEEIILAPEATRYYSKQQLMDMYLNTTFYGNQAYGAEAAALVYFNLHDTPKATAAAQLDLAQSALLAGIPQNPTLYNPFQHPQATFNRMQDVLKQMLVQGYITSLQEQAALTEVRKPDFFQPGAPPSLLAPHFVNYTLQELMTVLHVKPPELSRSGLVVQTTLDLPLQNKILKLAQDNVNALVKAHHLSDAAEVLIDFHTGAIRVLLGNIDPTNPQYGQFDVATQGYRQTGSSFKPFVYATAFEKGLDPGMPVLDAPFTLQLCCGLPSYAPQNYDLRFHGLLPVRYALQNSFNVPAVKVLYKTGVNDSLQTALNMGITRYTGIPNYTMVLGTLGVTLLDMTSAYGVFADGGLRVLPHAIETVTDTRGRLIYQPDTTGHRILTPQIAYLMTNVLSDNNARKYEFGPCSSLYLYSGTTQQCFAKKPATVYPAAVKTGTSQQFADNWTIGYTNDYVMGVWAGNNDNSPMNNVIGVTGAGPIWHDGMLLAEQGHTPSAFVEPPGMVQRTVTYPGLITTDLYIQGLPWTDWGLEGSVVGSKPYGN